jgi:uncharacterized protein (TIGR03545 family)
MTNSTDTETKVKKEKTPKKKGPIRFEAVIPITIILVLVGCYFHFFFDRHLRLGLEWTATQIHGAEVNIAGINTSFIKGSFELKGLQVTDKEVPTQNLVSLDSIRFGFLWDAILRMKVVINEASINEIQLYSPRKKPGFVLPPPKEEDSKNSLVAKSQKMILDQAKEKFDQNILGDLASILEGGDAKDQLNEIRDQLMAEKKITELTNELKAKEDEWNNRFKSLPKPEEFKKTVEKIKGFKLDKSNPIAVAKGIKDLNDQIKDLDQKVKSYTSAVEDLKKDVSHYEKEISGIDELVEKDVEALQKRLKIPDINTGDFAKQLFGKMFFDKIAGYKKYYDVAKEYIPPPMSKEERAKAKAEMVVPRKRGDGKNYKFPITTGYPLFWLKKGAISSRESSSEFSGNISGELLNLTTDQEVTKKDTEIKLAGDFPKQKVNGVKIHLSLDSHSNEAPKQSLKMKVASYPVSGLVLSKSDKAYFEIKDSFVTSDVDAVLRKEEASILVNNSFSQINFDVHSKNKQLDDILKGAVATLPTLFMNAKAGGQWGDLDVDIDSNLGSALATAVKAQVQVKIDEQKAKIKKIVDEKVLAQKDKLKAQYQAVKDKFDAQLNKQKEEIEKAKNEASQVVKDKSKEAGDGGTEKLKDLGKKLFKGFGG